MNNDVPPRAGPGPDDERQEAGLTDEERAQAVLEELRRLRVQDLALDMIVSLVTVGYQKLGLTDHTRELRDLDDARLSIDLLRACLDVLERERGVDALGDLRATLSAMQLSYARVVDDGPAGGESPPDEPRPEQEPDEAREKEPGGKPPAEAEPGSDARGEGTGGAEGD